MRIDFNGETPTGRADGMATTRNCARKRPTGRQAGWRDGKRRRKQPPLAVQRLSAPIDRRRITERWLVVAVWSQGRCHHDGYGIGRFSARFARRPRSDSSILTGSCHQRRVSVVIRLPDRRTPAAPNPRAGGRRVSFFGRCGAGQAGGRRILISYTCIKVHWFCGQLPRSMPLVPPAGATIFSPRCHRPATRWPSTRVGGTESTGTGRRWLVKR